MSLSVAIAECFKGKIITENETEASIAPSILEPWRSGNSSLSQAMENTIGFQRRRARFEFAPLDASPGRSDSEEPLTEPDLLGIRTPRIDLSEYDGRLELRVWVYLERGHTPGIRRFTWTRIKTTKTQTFSSDAKGRSAPDSTFWQPISRDRAFEQRLLAVVSQAMSQE